MAGLHRSVPGHTGTALLAVGSEQCTVAALESTEPPEPKAAMQSIALGHRTERVLAQDVMRRLRQHDRA